VQRDRRCEFRGSGSGLRFGGTCGQWSVRAAPAEVVWISNERQGERFGEWQWREFTVNDCGLRPGLQESVNSSASQGRRVAWGSSNQMGQRSLECDPAVCWVSGSGGSATNSGVAGLQQWCSEAVGWTPAVLLLGCDRRCCCWSEAGNLVCGQ
jgi:hypothetical protein